jgi:uncharacterized alkaline shock family protein YloU
VPRPRITDVEGHALVSDDVIARYAADAALEVEGVRELASGPLPRQRGIRLQQHADGVEIELALVLEWGVSIPDVGRAVQQRVAEYVGRMTDVELRSVDVVAEHIAPPVQA